MNKEIHSWLAGLYLNKSRELMEFWGCKRYFQSIYRELAIDGNNSCSFYDNASFACVVYSPLHVHFTFIVFSRLFHVSLRYVRKQFNQHNI